MNRTPSGVGIGLRRQLCPALWETQRRVDWLEITPENYIGFEGKSERMLATALERYAIRAHGVSLNVGGPDPLDEELLSALGRLLDRIEADVYTEHLCFSAAGGIAFHDLLPLPHSAAAVEHIAARARAVRERLGRPLLLENISTYALMPGGEMSEGEFVTSALEEADAGLLLDVNNVYVNAKNHGTDPRELLLSLPLERTGQMHVAGHKVAEGMLIDNHGRPVVDEVWALFELALERAPPCPILLEWDLDIPALDVVLDEADKARARVAKVEAAARGEQSAA